MIRNNLDVSLRWTLGRQLISCVFNSVNCNLYAVHFVKKIKTAKDFEFGATTLRKSTSRKFLCEIASLFAYITKFIFHNAQIWHRNFVWLTSQLSYGWHRKFEMISIASLLDPSDVVRGNDKTCPPVVWCRKWRMAGRGSVAIIVVRERRTSEHRPGVSSGSIWFDRLSRHYLHDRWKPETAPLFLPCQFSQAVCSLDAIIQPSLITNVPMQEHLFTWVGAETHLPWQEITQSRDRLTFAVKTRGPTFFFPA
jgi:hypothetical protein